jgi:xanthine dehydrogenase YagS FAD-binding subunit
MAVIRDMMPAFQLFQPTTTDEALGLLDEYQEQAWVLAGGLDSFDWLKDRVKRPAAVVDLGGVEELSAIRSATGGGLTIGAMAKLREVIRHPDVRSQYGLLVEAAELVASPQIRNQGTLGGNLAQDTRCWYYRDGWNCYRAGGNICYADTPTAMNREHCILGASRCVAVNPSDTAPALVALDAQMVVRRGRAERVIPAEEFFVGPEIDIERMTALEPGDLLMSIRVPSAWSGSRVYFEKVRDRTTWDFALVNVATALQESGGVIQDARVVVNGVAPTPVRLTAVENAIRGQARNEQTATRAGDVSIQGVSPLTHNGFKVNLMRNLVKRSIRDEPMNDV